MAVKRADIDHVTIGVSDLARSRAFYERALAPLRLKALRGAACDRPTGTALQGTHDAGVLAWIASSPRTGLDQERHRSNMTESVSESENPAIASPTPATPRPRTNRDWWPDQLDL